MRLTNEERLARYKLALNHVAVIKLDVTDATPVLPPRKQLEYLDAAITALTEVREALANDVQGNGALTSPPDLNIDKVRTYDLVLARYSVRPIVDEHCDLLNHSTRRQSL